MNQSLKFKNRQGSDPCLFLDCLQGPGGDLLGIVPRNGEFVAGNGRKPSVMSSSMTDKIASVLLKHLLEFRCSHIS